MDVAVVIVAAGAGNRLGSAVPKAFAELAGRPLLRHALDRVLDCPEVAHVVVVAPASHLGAARELLVDAEHGLVDVVAGGVERAESVARGLALLRARDGLVLVHDAARCCAPAELFTRIVAELRSGHPAVIPGLAVADTIKQVDREGYVVATPDRATLRAIQTPQGFLREVLLHAHQRAHDHPAGLLVTDDAGLVEASGTRVRVVPGDPWAEKITTEQDLAGFERLLRAR